MNKKKIINDPIYGFITIQHEVLFDCIQMQSFQRLRRIKQLGLTHLVYPGALHTRFQHALGAMHLMYTAIESLRSKEIEVTKEEEVGVLLAILLHDIGHGPFSHSLEHSLLKEVSHEFISLQLMERMNKELDGKLDLAILIFRNKYHKKFLHQLVSSQLDMDRLDYLRRDSFYTGVSEGTIGIERIIQMLNVYEDELVVDEKGIYSIEKFIMARRFMYWQVYLHKTSLAAEQLMLSILKRAKYLIGKGHELFASPFLMYFLKHDFSETEVTTNPEVLDQFCMLDDNDIISAIKVWAGSNDKILSLLCKMLIGRILPKIEIANEEFKGSRLSDIKAKVASDLGLDIADTSYFIFSGELSNSTYNSDHEQIKILYKDKRLRDIAEASETMSIPDVDKPVIKYFISYPK